MGRTGYEGGVGAGSHPATTAAILPAAPPTTTAAPAAAAAPTATAAPRTAPATASPVAARCLPEEAGPMDDLPIKQEEVEEPKMDTGEPGHRCVPRVVFVPHGVSRCVPGAIASCSRRFARSPRCPHTCPW